MVQLSAWCKDTWRLRHRCAYQQGQLLRKEGCIVNILLETCWHTHKVWEGVAVGEQGTEASMRVRERGSMRVRERGSIRGFYRGSQGIEGG